MTEATIEKSLADAAAALKALHAQYAAEQIVNTGLALVLIKSGILTATGIEIMRAVGTATYTDATVLEAIGDRIEGLHSLLNEHGQGNAVAPKYNG